MKLNEFKAIVNNIELKPDAEVNIKVCFGNNEDYSVTEIESFGIMNGNLVFTIKPPVKRLY